MELTVTDVIWEPMPGPVYSGDRITCKIGDELISGVVTVSPKALTVAMDLPVVGGIAGRSIDCLTPTVFTETPDEGSPANWYGLNTAKEILLAEYQGIFRQNN